MRWFKEPLRADLKPEPPQEDTLCVDFSQGLRIFRRDSVVGSRSVYVKTRDEAIALRNELNRVIDEWVPER